MESIFIVNKFAAIEDIADLGDVNELAAGETIIIGDGRKVIGVGSTPADLADVKEVVFMTKELSGKLRSSVSIPRQNIRNINSKVYEAPVSKVMRIGGTTANTSLLLDNNTEAFILIKNMTQNHTIAGQKLSISATKSSGESAGNFITRVVALINNHPANQTIPFVTAAALDASQYQGIQFTAANEHVDLQIMTDGMWKDFSAITVTQPKVAFGKGSDIVAMELDYSRNRGNSGYHGMNEAYFNAGAQASAGTNYDVATITWLGIAPYGATSTHVSAVNTMTLAVPTAEDFPAFTEVLDLLPLNGYTVVEVEAGGE